jgi:tetratricopeptide (TPR) repeat protein
MVKLRSDKSGSGPADTPDLNDLRFGNPIFETDTNLPSPRDAVESTNRATESRERDLVEFDNPANPAIPGDNVGDKEKRKSPKWRSARESNLLAEALQAKGDLTGAAEIHAEALEQHRKELGDTHHDTMEIIQRLGNVYHKLRHFDMEEPLRQENMRLCRAELGDESPLTMAAICKLGQLYCSKGDYSAAEPLLKGALKRRRKHFEPNHPVRCPTEIYIHHFGPSLRIIIISWPIYSASFLTGAMLSQQLLESTNALGRLYINMGKMVEAKPLMLEALALSRLLLPRAVLSLSAHLH